jgi:hypothetical protein
VQYTVNIIGGKNVCQKKFIGLLICFAAITLFTTTVWARPKLAPASSGLQQAQEPAQKPTQMPVLQTPAPAVRLPDKPAQAEIASASPNSVAIEPGKEVIINVNGKNLDKITKIEILLSNSPVTGVETRIGSSSPNMRQVTFKAQSDAKPGSYQIKAITDTQNILVPSNVFRLEVKAAGGVPAGALNRSIAPLSEVPAGIHQKPTVVQSPFQSPVQKTPALPSQTEVVSASPNQVLLEPGKEVITTLNGKNVDKITKLEVLLNNFPATEVEARLGPASLNSRQVTFKALSSAKPGSYQIKASAGAQTIMVSSNVFRLEVKGTDGVPAGALNRSIAPLSEVPAGIQQKKTPGQTPFQTPVQTSPEVQSTQMMPPSAVQQLPQIQHFTRPDISYWSPKISGRVSSELTIKGRDFVANAFRVWLGLQQLQVIYRSTGEIRAKLPDTSQTGKLVAGYGTLGQGDVQVTLSENYYMTGDPVITSVTPTSFQKGDQVTINGTDLQNSRPSTRGNYVKISKTTTDHIAADYISVSNWTVSPDGKKITFIAGSAVSMYVTDVRPNPEMKSLSGNLRIEPHGPGAEASIISPQPVSWKSGMTPLSITKVVPSKWGEADVDFILLHFDVSLNLVDVWGKGIDSNTKARMGNVNLPVSGFHTAMDYLSVVVPYTAQTNPVTLIRYSDNSVATSSVLKVVPAPRFDNSPQILSANLNEPLVLTGFSLVPGNQVPGLTYDFTFPWPFPSSLISFSFNATQNKITMVFSNKQALTEMEIANNRGIFCPKQQPINLVARYNGITKVLQEMKWCINTPQ